MDSEFSEALRRSLEAVPSGRVATCGAIARALGDVRAARAIATWLVEHPEIPGGHRVVRADGRPILEEARSRLGREGVSLVQGRVEPAHHLDRLRRVPFLSRLRDEQRRLARQVVDQDEPGAIDRVVGVDVSYRGDRTCAAAVAFAIKHQEPVEVAVFHGRAKFPYIPTYLAYREFPAIEAVVQRLSTRPDALMVDGHGQLHPALFGVACHTGVRLGIPTVGVAKHMLSGRVRSPVPGGAVSAIEIDGATRGLAWRPPGRSRPIYVSVGHRVSLDGALELVRRTTRRTYPEPLRIADHLSREMGRNEKREKGAAR